MEQQLNWTFIRTPHSLLLLLSTYSFAHLFEKKNTRKLKEYWNESKRKRFRFRSKTVKLCKSIQFFLFASVVLRLLWVWVWVCYDYFVCIFFSLDPKCGITVYIYLYTNKQLYTKSNWSKSAVLFCALCLNSKNLPHK